MNFNLKTPCSNCPFRTDVPPLFRVARAREILRVITLQQGTFSCHKTTRFEDDDQGEAVHVPRAKEEHCAGALILLERIERPNQLMRVAERIGMYDRTKLDMAAPVYESPDALIDACARLERQDRKRR